MTPLVDLHTHILPEVDDGADSLAEALKMLDLALSSGTTHIVLTPHYLAPDRARGCDKHELYERFEAFSKTAADRYPELSVYFGAEMVAVDNFQDVVADRRLITINNSRYVLTEFGFYDRFNRTAEAVDNILSFGLVPIIAHPERYYFIQDDPSLLEVFREKGALFQVNVTSLLGLSGLKARQIAFETIGNGLASFVASDAHSTYQRRPDLAEGYAIVAAEFSRALAEDVFYNNPLAVVKNEKIIL